MRVVHVIVSLYDGGAQAVLFSLLTHENSHEHVVISLTNQGKYSGPIRDMGVPVHHLDMPLGRLSWSGLRRLRMLIREARPDVVQTWMYHSDLLGGLIARLAGIKNIVWGIHHSTLDNKGTSRSTRLVVKLLSMLSRYVPKRIISCSRRALEVHVAAGYGRSKMVFIGNGYDLQRFQPIAGSLDSLPLTPDATNNRIVFATIARWNPQKDQRNLIDACQLLVEQGAPAFVCLLIGPDVDNGNSDLVSYIKQHNLQNNVLLCGSTTDVPLVMNAIDFHVLPSAFGEAFPNVVAEAMSCGTPCIVTDVGDAAEMVSDTGWVVPPRNPVALAVAIQDAMLLRGCTSMNWAERQQGCRNRALENFDIHKMVAAYENVWCS